MTNLAKNMLPFSFLKAVTAKNKTAKTKKSNKEKSDTEVNETSLNFFMLSYTSLSSFLLILLLASGLFIFNGCGRVAQNNPANQSIDQIVNNKGNENYENSRESSKSEIVGTYQYGKKDEKITLTVSPGSPLKAGVPLKLSVEVDSDKNSEISFPDISQNNPSGDAGVFKIETDENRSEKTPFLMKLRGKKRTARIYTLFTTLPGEYILPGFEVMIDDTPVFTEDISLTIETALTEHPDLYDVTEPLKGKGLYTWQIILIISGLVIIVLIFIFFKQIKAFFKRLFSPRFNALKAAKKKMEHLSNFDLTSTEKRKELYFELSALLRSYIDSVLPFGWSGKTTEELLPELENNKEIYPASLDKIKDFLLRGEEIKFAGSDVPMTKAKSDLIFCEEWIEMETIHLKQISKTEKKLKLKNRNSGFWNSKPNDAKKRGAEK